MPRLSDDTLFKRALPLAIADRMALADAYPRESEHWAAARAQAAEMEKLKGRKLGELSDEEQQVAYSVFDFAAIWEAELARSMGNSDRAVSDYSARNARMFTEVRLRRWGKSEFERMLENSKPISLEELLKRTKQT
ncbi:hypothetical protein AB4Y45_33890 [Paraburkholderia sp. EG287A]|uniref:hypothetical protein n=1 Tax=Paraburkholderia sp. EG287A TaxID=3237012 RepID=UPI0034D30F49